MWLSVSNPGRVSRGHGGHTQWLHTPATGVPHSLHTPAAGVAVDGVACAAMAASMWKTLKVEPGDLQVLIIVRALPCGSTHVSVDPFHSYVRLKIPLGRWSSEIRVDSVWG